MSYVVGVNKGSQMVQAVCNTNSDIIEFLNTNYTVKLIQEECESHVVFDIDNIDKDYYLGDNGIFIITIVVIPTTGYLVF